MTGLTVRFAAGLYDRFLSLYTGEVKAEGLQLEFVPVSSARSVFDRMTSSQEYDVAEFSFSEYVSRFSVGRCPFVAIPVFPSRAFRHGMISVNADAGISSPRELRHKRIGLPLYTMTAAIWQRGMLQEEYGVDFSTVSWIQGATNAQGRHGEPNVMPLLRPLAIEENRSGNSLSALIEAGVIDATFGTALPAAMRTNPRVRRLFPNFKEIEQDYYRRTKIFPIMHVLVIRRELYDANPFVAGSLYRACTEAKAAALERMRYLAAPQYMIPWLAADVDEIEELFDGDPYPYGIARNRHTLEKLVTYLVDQSVIEKAIAVDDLFVPVDEAST